MEVQFIRFVRQHEALEPATRGMVGITYGELSYQHTQDDRVSDVCMHAKQAQTCECAPKFRAWRSTEAKPDSI